LILVLVAAAIGRCAAKYPVEYTNAINDVRNIEIDEISNSLTPIVETNNSLIWKYFPRVLTVTLTDWFSYKDYEGRNLFLKYFLC